MGLKKYVLAIDQSTSNTKAMLFDQLGVLSYRADLPHRQIVTQQGWIEHDPDEIYDNLLHVIKNVINKANILPEQIVAAGISNQRETALAWDNAGKPFSNAVVWHCARGLQICEQIEKLGYTSYIKEKTGLHLSPYFSAAKFSWIIRNIPEASRAASEGNLKIGTMDSYLLYRLTGNHATDYSNASRTQLFNIHSLEWDSKLCSIFEIPMNALPEVRFSDSFFGSSDFGGIFKRAIPIYSILGDSHAALFAQGCLDSGTGKATYGTGSSVMINTGCTPIHSSELTTSLAWGINKKIQYVLEGNINYTGAIFTWLIHDMELISSAHEIEPLARSVDGSGGVYLVPAFSGLGAPYWKSNARAVLCGMNRSTKKAHIVRSAEESIAYQITDIMQAAIQSGISLKNLHADGGSTHDSFLMQFQADMLQIPLIVSQTEELSGAGVAFLAGLACGFYSKKVLSPLYKGHIYYPTISTAQSQNLYAGWQKAIKMALYNTPK